MARKRDPNKMATLHPMMLTNGDVDELVEAGFLPVVRWVKGENAYARKPRLYNTEQARTAAGLTKGKE